MHNVGKILSKLKTKLKTKNFLLVRLVFLIVVLDVLNGNFRDVIKEFRQFYIQKAISEETLHVRRIEKIKDILPEKGIVGYFTDKQYSWWAADDMYFCLTQYALSPLIILRSTKPKVIIAYVNDSFNIIEFSKKYNCHLLKNFNDGILVFSKKEQ